MDILTKLGINDTFFVQLINFILLVVVLYLILYKPLFKTIKERTEKIKKGLDLTEKMELEYKKLEGTKQEIIESAQKEATKIISTAEEKATQRSQKLIDETNKKGEEMLKEYEKTLQKERELLESKLNDKVYESVKLVLKNVLMVDKEIDKKFIEESSKVK